MECLAGNPGGFSIVSLTDGYMVGNGNYESIKQAGYARRISEIFWSGNNFEEITGITIPEGKFYVRVEDFNGCHGSREEPVLGNLLNGKGRIDFRHPDFVVMVYHCDRWYAGIEVWSRRSEKVEERRAPMRPFFSPISLSPKIARLMINLSGTSSGDTIFDPFCGTGGILIEAAIMGRKIIGNDFSLSMASGTKLNLKYYGIRGYMIYNSDILELNLPQSVDAIVTDMPYGRNSPITSRDLEVFYRATLEHLSSFIKSGCKIIIMINDPDLIHLPDNLNVIKSLSFRVHRSLVRNVMVLVRT